MRFALAAALLLASGGAKAADCTRPEPVAFAAEDDSVTIENGTPSETVDCYQVSPRSGQRMTITLVGAENNAMFAVYAPGWRATCTADHDCDVAGDQLVADRAASWSDTIAAAGTYLIVIDNSRSEAEYTLTVELR